MQDVDFLTLGQHFDHLMLSLDSDDQTEFNENKHVRQEVAYRGRNFLVYQMEDDQPKELDRIAVSSFQVDDVYGASTKLYSPKTKKSLIVDYKPVRLFNYPIFVWLPLHFNLRWNTTPKSLDTGSLAFQLCLKTQSRRSLREPGVIYCETGRSFGKEFNTPMMN